MKVYASILVFILFEMGSVAFAKGNAPAAYRQGAILKVDRQEVRSPDLCCYSGTDRPSQTEYYAFEVSVRIGCTTYEGRYETPFDYLPSALSRGRSVQVRATKHYLYFEAPIWSDGKVPIVHRAHDGAALCGPNAAP